MLWALAIRQGITCGGEGIFGGDLFFVEAVLTSDLLGPPLHIGCTPKEKYGTVLTIVENTPEVHNLIVCVSLGTALASST